MLHTLQMGIHMAKEMEPRLEWYLHDDFKTDPDCQKKILAITSADWISDTIVEIDRRPWDPANVMEILKAVAEKFKIKMPPGGQAGAGAAYR